MAVVVYPSAIVLPILLAGHGYRKGSLSVSGALAALIVGFVSFATPVKSFGVTLLAFYFVGSRATKIGHARKAKLETEGERSATHKSSSGGQRDAWQVLCNSLTSVVSVILFNILFVDERPWRNGEAWCLFDEAPKYAAANAINRLQRSLDVPLSHLVPSDLPRSLFFVMLGHFACCMGDTLASELGILAKHPPRLIVPPFRTVPPGTNGGLSVQGTLGSLLGGTFVGLVAGTVVTFYDNRACTAQAASIILKTAVLGSLGGVGGSAIDSILGATLQRTWYDSKRKQVLVGRLPKQAANKDSAWQVVTGHDILSNNTVNFLSSLLTAFAIAYIGRAIF